MIFWDPLLTQANLASKTGKMADKVPDNQCVERFDSNQALLPETAEMAASFQPEPTSLKPTMPFSSMDSYGSPNTLAASPVFGQFGFGFETFSRSYLKDAPIPNVRIPRLSGILAYPHA